MKRASLLLLALLLACVSSKTPPDRGWLQWTNPEDAGFDSRSLDDVRAHADEVKSGAVMVVYRGNVLAAWGDVERKLELYSVRKSLYAAMYGIAVEKKLIDPDATLAELGIDDLQALTAEEKQARIEDLLFARSGVYHPSAYAPSDQTESRPARGRHAPGTHWFYNNWDFNVAGALLERAAGKPLGQLFDDWIARPIGMEDFVPSDVYVHREPRTSRWPALVFRMSARDLARFGTLWANQGRWKGKQVIPAKWIEHASTSRSSTGANGEGYAMMWWTYEAGSLNGERYPNATRYDILQGRGTGGQTVAIVRQLDLVFVHRADTDHGRSVSGRQVWTMLDRVLGAKRGEPKANASFQPLTATRFESQLPPFQWPRAIELTQQDRDALVGKYEFRPGLAGEIFVHEGALFAFMPGKGEAQLFATSPTEFYIRADPTVAIRFENDRVIIRMDGRELTGTRLPPG